jgi:hypothetical protein
LPKDATERRSGSDDLEKSRAHGCCPDGSRGTGATEREFLEAATLIHGQALERPRIALPVMELTWRELEELTARCPGEDPHQAFGLLEGQRTQQDCVHDAEDRRVGANAKRQDADDGNSERWCPGHDPERITKIGKHGTHPRVSLRRSNRQWIGTNRRRRSQAAHRLPPEPGVSRDRRIAAAPRELFFEIPDDEVAPLG